MRRGAPGRRVQSAQKPERSVFPASSNASRSESVVLGLKAFYCA
ncbi:MAG: hypothetical protein ACRELB_10710 [Polyangiaceae bacterium]